MTPRTLVQSHVMEQTVKPQGKRVYVGLSGGVDSATVAALLQKEGYAVTGVFIQGWYPPGLRCTWASDRRDAMRVAAHLRIPFLTLDASKEYKKAVIDYLLREYGAGRTPNPDIMCNKEVKFGAFYNFAMSKGADFIATGHYARTRGDAGGVHLLRGVDTEKDQSYFLWAVSREALSKTLFPLGGYKKSEVRTLAKQWHLPVAEKKDSQGICFLGNVSIEDFLKDTSTTTPGDACDETGAKVGVHRGSVLYTLGERIALSEATTSGPWYVVAKNMRDNTVVVSKTRSTKQGSPITFILEDTSFIQTPPQDSTAQYRYHCEEVRGTYDQETHLFTPHTPLIEPIASGQSLVLYDGEECLGGGIIV